MVTQQIFGRNIPDEALAISCIEDMMLRIRNHPSLAHFLGHDETFPTPSLSKAYLEMIERLRVHRTYQPHSGAFCGFRAQANRRHAHRHARAVDLCRPFPLLPAQE